ncbi:hypothetical protein BVY02_02525 [bacterium J17]|nr:hypothetical protein BVY02_02525 [bacterium J17]
MSDFETPTGSKAKQPQQVEVSAEPQPLVDPTGEAPTKVSGNPIVDNRRTAPIAVSRARTADRKSRLSVMPLAVLLPEIGSTRSLMPYADFFASRLEQLDNEKLGADESSLKERSMIKQVLGWLSVEGRD